MLPRRLLSAAPGHHRGPCCGGRAPGLPIRRGAFSRYEEGRFPDTKRGVSKASRAPLSPKRAAGRPVSRPGSAVQGFLGAGSQLVAGFPAGCRASGWVPGFQLGAGTPAAQLGAGTQGSWVPGVSQLGDGTHFFSRVPRGFVGGGADPTGPSTAADRDAREGR